MILLPRIIGSSTSRVLTAVLLAFLRVCRTPQVANLEADSVGHSQVVEAEHVAEAESLRRPQWLDGRVGWIWMDLDGGI